MSRYTSLHDEPWFSDPDEPWGGSHRKIMCDPDDERDREIDDALTGEAHPGIYWARVNGSQHLQRVGAEQYAQIYGGKQ
jgi:hypothetical protein